MPISGMLLPQKVEDLEKLVSTLQGQVKALEDRVEILESAFNIDLVDSEESSTPPKKVKRG